MTFPTTLYVTEEMDPNEGLTLYYNAYTGVETYENNDAVAIYRLIDTGYARVQKTHEYVSDSKPARTIDR